MTEEGGAAAHGQPGGARRLVHREGGRGPAIGPRGWPGLEDRTSQPHRTPRITPSETVEAILRTRVERCWGPHRIAPLLDLTPSTMYAVLARSGYSGLRDADRLSGVPVRDVREQDHKKLGRIPIGGGLGDGLERVSVAGDPAIPPLDLGDVSA